MRVGLNAFGLEHLIRTILHQCGRSSALSCAYGLERDQGLPGAPVQTWKGLPRGKEIMCLEHDTVTLLVRVKNHVCMCMFIHSVMSDPLRPHGL